MAIRIKTFSAIHDQSAFSRLSAEEQIHLLLNKLDGEVFEWLRTLELDPTKTVDVQLDMFITDSRDHLFTRTVTAYTLD